MLPLISDLPSVQALVEQPSLQHGRLVLPQGGAIRVSLGLACRRATSDDVGVEPARGDRLVGPQAQESRQCSSPKG